MADEKALGNARHSGKTVVGSPHKTFPRVSGNQRRYRVAVRQLPIPVYRADKISRVRAALHLSQRALAAALGVSPRTVEAWEAGRNIPSGPAARLLYLIECDHTLLDKLVMR